MYSKPRPLTKCLRADISIQGSEFNYSTPREYLNNIQDYKEVEIVLFSKEGKWLHPDDDSVFKKFSQLEELVSSYENGPAAVGGYIPIDLVNDLVDYLNQ